MHDIDFSNLSITIVGLGLIGGSFARAIKENIIVKNLWAVDVDENVLIEAQNLKVIDKGFIEPKFPLQNSDIIILCIYPGLTVKFIKENICNFKKNAVITDTSGIKNKIVEAVGDFIREDLDFIGGHPMAGKELSGFSNSSGQIFCNAQYILTPGKYSKAENVSVLKEFFLRLKIKSVTELSPEMHDNMVAYTSHLPHIIACALVNDAADAVSCIGGSFKDATRVADINAELWSELLIENKSAVVEHIKKFVHDINGISKLIESDNQEYLKLYLEKSCEIKKKIKDRW